mmetsp:Transcript_89963/g.254830  ORF Transcript_89963/g.254830 Transcript_89963/m.254830 type:complete len:214 (+) Transcript_89963:521-1162(+)
MKRMPRMIEIPSNGLSGSSQDTPERMASASERMERGRLPHQYASCTSSCWPGLRGRISILCAETSWVNSIPTTYIIRMRAPAVVTSDFMEWAIASVTMPSSLRNCRSRTTRSTRKSLSIRISRRKVKFTDESLSADEPGFSPLTRPTSQVMTSTHWISTSNVSNTFQPLPGILKNIRLKRASLKQSSVVKTMQKSSSSISKNSGTSSVRFRAM